jgi:hypothetical protein
MAKPFGPNVTRRDVYSLRDRSKLSRSDFFIRFFLQNVLSNDRREV